VISVSDLIEEFITHSLGVVLLLVF